jgi:hypothetical protein
MLMDNFLYAVAGWMNGETFTIPSFGAWSSTVLTPAGTDTSLAHEYATRSAATGARVLGDTTFTITRSSVLASSSGDYINSLGLLTASSGGTLYAEALVPSILHTTTYDFEVDWKISVSRG